MQNELGPTKKSANPIALKPHSPKPVLLMVEILHYLKDPKLWELCHIFLIIICYG